MEVINGRTPCTHGVRSRMGIMPSVILHQSTDAPRIRWDDIDKGGGYRRKDWVTNATKDDAPSKNVKCAITVAVWRSDHHRTVAAHARRVRGGRMTGR